MISSPVPRTAPRLRPITLATPPGYDLKRAVCSYGYFVLAPNRWDPVTLTFSRPLRLAWGRVIGVTIEQKTRGLTVRTTHTLGKAARADVVAQVRRMLRLDEDLSAWYRLCPEARRRKFGRLFRSPTFFEDIVKTITGCNVSWPNTCNMNRLLCAHVGGPAPGNNAFPSPEQVAAMEPHELAAVAKVGYRAERIVRLARDVVEGRLDLAWFEDPARTSDELYAELLRIHGLGPYAAANLCCVLGHYERIAIDTETYRHFCTTQGRQRPQDPKRLHDDIEAHYARYAPYQFLGYWFDLWRFYERFIGRPAWRWQPGESTTFTAAAFRKTDGA